MPGQPTGGGSRWTDLIKSVSDAVRTLNNISSVLSKTFPQWTGTTATSATGGAATALPAQPAGYMVLVNPVTGATIKVPFYS